MPLPAQRINSIGRWRGNPEQEIVSLWRYFPVDTAGSHPMTGVAEYRERDSNPHALSDNGF